MYVFVYFLCYKVSVDLLLSLLMAKKYIVKSYKVNLASFTDALYVIFLTFTY